MFGTGFYIVCAFLVGLGAGLLMEFSKKEIIIKDLNQRLSYVVMEYNKLFLEVERERAFRNMEERA